MKPIPALSIIAAMSMNRVIGGNNRLLWHLPSDLKRFKSLTAGHPVIMGRKTWESIPMRLRPLPDRTNIIVTRQSGYPAEAAIVVDSIDAAFAEASRAPGHVEMFLIGGAELYAECIPIASSLYLTRVHASLSGDAYFPNFDAREWFVWESRAEALIPGDQFPTSFVKMRRKQ